MNALRTGEVLLFLASSCAAAAIGPHVPDGTPQAMIDLSTEEGARLVRGTWRYSDTKIIEVGFRNPGADGQPTGPPNKTYDYTPHAGASDFDDSRWEAIQPTSLGTRRSNGRLSFNWYRVNITVPDRIGTFDPTGSTVVFETSVDDYAEVWVDGELSRAQGQSGGSVIGGWNVANRLVVGRGVKPGKRIQLAIFGANGPLSNPPTNFIWMRYTKLAFFSGSAGPRALIPAEVNVEVLRKDPLIDAIIGANPKVFKLADGFQFSEGPVWVRDGGYLLFSDPNSNVIYKYTPDGNQPGQLSVFRTSSGYSGADIAEFKQPGSNGLTLDRQGRLTINEHGNRQVTRVELDGTITVLARHYEGKRLNSPNDLVYRSDGTLFFTDPPFGLPKFFDDIRKQLPFSGVFAIHRDKLQLVSSDMHGPNGVALSPDEKYLYVTNWEDKKKIVRRYSVNANGTLAEGELFFDMTSAPGEDACDGVKVDVAGNVYVSGPGGLWILSPDGRHLGTVVTPKHVHNFAWGDEDGKTLYLCARDGLYSIRLNVAGVRP